MSSMICPYCKAENPTAAAECATCRTEFPWHAEIERLKADLKAREVNRGQATFTLIEEVFGAATGGRPVSIAALKGFAFAWLFPRALIVVGSVIGGVVLIIQTAILFQQNRLLRDQTIANQYAQAEALRAQVSATELVWESLNSFALLAREARAAAGLLEQTNCPACKTTTFAAARAQMGTDVGEASERLHKHFALLERFGTRIFEGDGSRSSGSMQGAGLALEAHSRCGFHLASARRLISHSKVIRELWYVGAVPVAVGVDVPALELPRPENFDAFMDPSPERDASELGRLLTTTTTVDAFIGRSLTNMAVVASDLEAAAGTCMRRLLVDKAVLLELESKLSPEAFGADK